MFTQTKALPRVLSFSEIKYYVFSVFFTILAVGVPSALHQFHVAGQIFVPMHFFVIVAGLLFGWKTGLLVGILSPLMSYGLTQMPVVALLSQITVELAVYGFAAGFLRERNLNAWVSLFSAMMLGRAARILFIVLFAPKMNAWQFIEMSWPGILLQLALVPLTIYLLQKFVFSKRV
jgi:hypothetical protein